MATKYENVYNRFINKIKKDKNFFSYKNCTEDEIEAIIKRRCFSLLDEATILVNNEIVNFEIDFTDRNDEDEVFNFDLIKIEEELIAEKMYFLYFKEEEVKVKQMQKYLGNDISMFSPAEERKTFENMLEKVNSRYEKILDDYNARLRDGSGYNLTGVSEDEVSVVSSWI